jgi:hypothetical protein
VNVIEGNEQAAEPKTAAGRMIMNALKLTKFQREQVDKIINLDPTINPSSLINVLGTMQSNARAKYLKDAYLNLLETRSSDKFQVDIASTLDIIDTDAIMKLYPEEHGKLSPSSKSRKTKGTEFDDDGYKVFNFEKRELTPSEILEFQEMILDFFMQHPGCDVSNIDMSIYYDIDERSYSILINQVKLIYKIINSSYLNLSEHKCSFCNQLIDDKRGMKGIIIAGESTKRIENNDFKTFHKKCYANFLKTRNVEDEILQQSKNKLSSYIPIPKTVEELELKLTKLGIKILSHEEENSIHELIVREGENETNFKTLIFDSKTGNLYLDEEIITDFFDVKKKMRLS